jgi:SAM-dependent methyltransferase
MFDGKYFDWNQKRIKGIVDHFGYKFFYGKKVVDLGCGYADLSGVLYRLGSDVTAVDVRQDHLKVVSKKFPGIKVVRANLEGPWPFFGSKFDMVLDLGVICHLGSFEEHLKAVCSSTTYLVLETAVCDSSDPYKCTQVAEGKENYDLSFNGMGCRPSAAAIERVLTECGMTFKRMDSSKFNSGEYVYDWVSKDDNSTNIHKRRIWLASKNQAGAVISHSATQPAVFIQPAHTPTFPSGTPKQFIHSRMALEKGQRIGMLNSFVGMSNSFVANNYVEPKAGPLNFQVMKNSKEFSIITPENYQTANTYQTSGVILPNTLSSKMWMKKLAPLFPNLKVSSKIINMLGFNKTNDTPNVIMCSIDNLIASNRIWIEEWVGELSESHLSILRGCQNILTPSLVNAQEILKHIPAANVLRVEKPWPMIPAIAVKNDYFIYFEKSEEITRILLQSWNDTFGKLIVVGSRLILPPFAEFISDTVDYNNISSLLMGAKAIIDIAPNNYYMSGVLNLANALSLPIITNNQAYFNMNGSIPIMQDNSIYPTMENITKSIGKLVNSISKVKFNELYNDNLNLSIQKLVGV